MAEGKTSTAERILDAAEAGFAAGGYAATSLGDIAAEVGIRPPSLYNHFKSKEDLYVAVLERLLDPFFEMLDGFLAQPLDAERGADYIATMMEHHARVPNLARLLQHAALAGDWQVTLLNERWYRPFFERTARLLENNPALVQSASDDLRYVVVGFNNLILGYVSMAALHAEMLGGDPFAPETVAGQTAFLRELSRTLWTR